jgi:hypothetical protein
MSTQIRRTAPEIDDLAAALTATRKSGIGAGSKFHFATADFTIDAAAASSLGTSITLANQIKRVLAGNLTAGGNWIGHLLDTNAHTAADTTNTTSAADATSLATGITLANEMKADFNAHLTQSGVHPNNDGLNAVATADATDQSSLNTLLNALKAAINLHIGDALGGTALRAIPA